MRRAKIVCTLGPAVGTPRRIRELVYAGMDVARLNMSHGSHEEHAERYHHVRAASDDSGKAVAVLADLQGPKIRLETFADGPVQLRRGMEWTITTRDVPGDAESCGTTYKGLPGDVKVGDPILIDDGKVRLRAIEVTDTDVRCEVLVGGKVSDHKGINLPGVAVSVPAMSEKDIEDLRFALHLGVDFIALSFVRDAKDAQDVRKVMDEEGIRLPIIAKIEKPQAIDNLDEVIRAFDGFMVARGDLAVECPLEDVPFLQKQIVEKARLNAKPVIVATQMLESMISSPSPTRAEASDVANAVLDGADAVMLSGETSVGDYPIHTVETMARIVETTERRALSDEHFGFADIKWAPRTKSGVIAKAAGDVAAGVGASYLVAFTTTGDTARRMSRLRGAPPVLAFSPESRVRSRLALSWGVETFLTDEAEHTDQMVRQVDEALLKIGRVEEGDLVVIVAGAPPGIPGSTNALRVHRIGDAINRVTPAYEPQA
ncbi:pyruvate kinase [Nocardioides bruguierae]|uniref:Pyruvate kinase n=1 Tax=Nocardioides bruguierae TaxID=2945102 RepID=A0A9X2D9E4_9ACTN|nr:pyruvate kinase [Nocardioides bruguierae]MCL8027551.1 pyruvate kinase [Nocardioides bruguierae]MCM0621571.1 pyruvate kinase [Nocardioides bruguierae]